MHESHVYLLLNKTYYATQLCRGIAGIKTFVKRSGSVLETIEIAQGNVLIYVSMVTIKQVLELVISISIVETA